MRGSGGPAIGTQFGYNFVAGNLRLGVEVETENYRNLHPVLLNASLNGRIGLVLNHNLLLYAQAGIGTLQGNPSLNAGFGVELLLNPNLAVFAEAKAMRIVLGGGGVTVTSLRAGINYYFGR